MNEFQVYEVIEPAGIQTIIHHGRTYLVFPGSNSRFQVPTLEFSGFSVADNPHEAAVKLHELANKP